MSNQPHTAVPSSDPEYAPEDIDHFKRLLTKDIRVIRVIHADLFGRQRGKQFAATVFHQLLDGIAYSKMSISEDLLGVPVDETAFPSVAGHPDLFARIEPGSAVVPPWEADAIWVLASLFEKGSQSELCARGALATARKRLDTELNLRVVAAGEPEFYVFTPSTSGTRSTPYATNGVSYTMDRITDPSGAVGRIHRNVIDFGIGVTVVNREFSPGQFEINLHHAEAQLAADQVFLLKTAVKELAIIEGLEANFMAKPLTDEEGSSLHVHMSFWNDEGVNIFSTVDGGLSDRAMAAIAGIQEHAPAILAFAAPTVNSYKRLRGNGLSPRSSNWAEDNRYSFIRVPAERGNATRFELRAGDASASSHLLMAAMIHAARDGIQRELVPSKAGAPLPRSLEESIQALESSSLFRDGFGDELVNVYAALKRAEIASFESTVTDWEWNLYHSHI
jgi:glutamine synthetase